MTIPIKHQEFIKLVAKGTNQSEAYTLTNPNKNLTKGTIKVESSKLAKKYAELIAQERKRIKEIVQAAQDQSIATVAQMHILSAAERMEWLTKLVSGEIKAKRPFVIGGKIMEYPEEPSHNDRIKALAELNKMDGSYAPQKVAQTNVEGKDISLFERLITEGAELLYDEDE